MAHWGPQKYCEIITRASYAQLAEHDLLFYPMPGIAQHAYLRSFLGEKSYSICGITHTTCLKSVMDDITALTTSPVQPWDALICTSQSVRRSVEQVLDAQREFLDKRLKAKREVLPLLPVIPLGVHTEDFTFTDAQRLAARRRIGANKNTIVVLSMGQLSFHSTVHPFPMYRALEMVAQFTGKDLLLVECGWCANDNIARVFAQAHAAVCPHVRVLHLDGKVAKERLAAWAGADIFCSLADNIQETFSLAPVEAMAAGLPVVGADWDGYRDSVRHGQDGFMVRTLTPGSGPAAELIQDHAWDVLNHNRYIGYAGMITAVDIDETAQALLRLVQSSVLRQRMGASGRERARQVFDWRHVLGQYEALWQEMNAKRLAAACPESGCWPARMDPFSVFASYPTAQVTPYTEFSLVDLSLEEASAHYADLGNLAMLSYAASVLPSPEGMDTILRCCAQKTSTAEEILRAFPLQHQHCALRGILWLCKVGLLQWRRAS